MADFSTNISNAITLIGPSLPFYWGAHNWNAFTWAGSIEFGITFEKGIPESLTWSDDFDSGISTTIYLDNSITIDSDRDQAYLRDGSGYLYVWPGPVTDHDEDGETTFTETSRPSNAFSKTSRPATSWS